MLTADLGDERLAREDVEKAHQQIQVRVDTLNADLDAERLTRAEAEQALSDIRLQVGELTAGRDAERSSKEQAERALEDIQVKVDVLTADLGNERLAKDAAEKATLEIQVQVEALSKELERVPQKQLELGQRLADSRIQHEKTLKALLAAEIEAQRLKRLFKRSSGEAADPDEDRPPVRHLVLTSLPYGRGEEVAAALSEAAALRVVKGAQRWFPNDFLLDDAFSPEVPAVANTHLDAAPRNLRSLRDIDAALVLLIADPRSVVAKRAEALVAGGEKTESESRISPDVGERRLGDFTEAVDWQIEHFVPHIGKWYSGWLDYLSSRPNCPVIEVREDELQQEQFVDALAAVSPTTEIQPLQLPPSKAKNPRHKLSDSQEARLLAELPEAVREHFDW